jgi:hypothetical protein
MEKSRKLNFTRYYYYRRSMYILGAGNLKKVKEEKKEPGSQRPMNEFTVGDTHTHGTTVGRNMADS